MRRRFSVIATYLIIAATISIPRVALAEAFGNSSVAIPKIGMAFFDTPITFHEKPWGMDYQWTFGSSFMQAFNYRWWWTADVTMGFGRLSVENKPFLGSFMGGAGLRFNIFQDDFRPHFGLSIQYCHFLGAAARAIPLDLGWPIFVGLKPYFGMEWLFYSEMALAFDAAYGIYVNVNEPFRQIVQTNLSFAFYF